MKAVWMDSIGFQTQKGDRFWYENYFAPSAFSRDQLTEIRRTTLARVLCDTSKLEKIQPNPFMKADIFE